MPFNTLSYFLFLPVVFLLHYFTPDKFRWLVLLVASYFFYAALKVPHLIAVLLLITTITYFTGILIGRKEDPCVKQYLLWGGISANVLTLIVLKYLPFLTQNLNIVLKKVLTGTAVPVSNTIIAIGASYFIFQAISYLIDVYLEIEKPERHFGHFALYMSFFPKLLQGPIERGGDLLPQFRIPYVFSYDNVRSGMLLFALGLLKKVVIADRLAMMVNPVFNDLNEYNGFSLLLATYYYSLQIYFDFSGYTDMALGTAKMFNICLTQNFNNPYFARSIADFWRRWHISFSRWILDYIFKPLQMSWRNYGNWGIFAALLVTFTISGLWHGANWGFVVWGALHGIYMAFSIPYKDLRKKCLNYLGINNKSLMLAIVETFIVFNLISFAWIFFRTDKLNDAAYIISNCLKGVFELVYQTSIKDIIHGKLNLSLGKGLNEVAILFASLLTITFIENSKFFTSIQMNKNMFTRWLYYISIIASIMLLGFYGNYQFIYNRF